MKTRTDVIVRDLTIDVTGAVDLPGPLHTAVTLFVPEPLRDGAVVAFGFPGGGYNRRYFDVDVDAPGNGGYSEARWHAERGWIYVACDHLGVGDSSYPDPSTLTFESMAAANDATVRRVAAGLEQGSLVDGLAPVTVRARLGFGQSMGGCLAIVAQGRHRTFDAIGILGFSAIHTVMPSPGGEPSRQLEPERGSEVTDLEDSTAALSDTFGYAFHWPDVPASVVGPDISTFPFREGSNVPAWGRNAMPPPMAATMLSPGAVGEEAAGVDVPVFVAAGERDVVPDVHAEPTAYTASSDITVLVVPRMAHMHNFAGTRELLWRNTHAWGERVSGTR